MNLESVRPYRKMLLFLSALGFAVPNGAFLYFAVSKPVLLLNALQNPIALVFILEAFFLMLLFAFWIYRFHLRSPNWVGFIILSLVGSLAFSVPFALYRYSQPKN